MMQSLTASSLLPDLSGNRGFAVGEHVRDGFNRAVRVDTLRSLPPS